MWQAQFLRDWRIVLIFGPYIVNYIIYVMYINYEIYLCGSIIEVGGLAFVAWHNKNDIL